MPSLTVVGLLLLFLLTFCHPSGAIRSFPDEDHQTTTKSQPNLLSRFAEAPEYRNGEKCPVSWVHIAMTLDSEYLRGSMAAVHSVLKHASCPENIFFHFISSDSDSVSPLSFTRLVRSTFPSLRFKVYLFRENRVKSLISSSIRQALENPLNYARNYLADILDDSVSRVIYLDSDLLAVDDIHKLWSVSLTGNRVIGAPEYCHANFTKYFTDAFWSDGEMERVFQGRKPCYFNTGVMVMDLSRWRQGDYRRRIEGWMEVQKQTRIYELGSLPPFLLVFGGDVEGIEHRWNQHGLGGDNVVGSCRALHPGPVSLLHWSGKGKPWARLDANKACPLDYLWAPYDLYLHQQKL